MSCIYKGSVIETELSKNSRGGTEMMRNRLLENIRHDLLKDFAIHFSRPRDIPQDVKNILYCHDLAEDPENRILQDGGCQKFDHFVFVTAWQRDQYITYFKIPYSKCTVIHNAIEKKFELPDKDKDYSTIRFIYHTTPHRGLELLVPIFEALTDEYENIHLDVYSGFGIYGWEQRDEPYKGLYSRIEASKQMTYHGVKSNDEVLEALSKSHIFLYPNVWKETSCIALIEAIKHGLLCIHPNYGGLTETASNATTMYDWTEDTKYHANFAYSVAKQVLETQKRDPNYLHNYATSDRFALARHNISTYGIMWNKLLKDLSDGGHNSISQT